LDVANVSVGSKADLTLGANDVGFYLNNRHGMRQSNVMEEFGLRPTAYGTMDASLDAPDRFSIINGRARSRYNPA
jgi:hypothetical protein